MKKRTLLILAASLIVTFSSCEKGDTGPAGPQGPAGPTGNANVIGTNTITPSNWILSGAFYKVDLTAPAITQDIVDVGIVMVFKSYSDGWSPLPDINGINTTTYDFETGLIHIYNSNSDGTTPTNPGGATFRVVIISSSKVRNNPGVNWHDYKTIKQVFNLND